MDDLKPIRIHYVHTRIMPTRNASSKNPDSSLADKGSHKGSNSGGSPGRAISVRPMVFDDIDISSGGGYSYTYHDFEIDKPILRMGKTDATNFQCMALVVSARLFDTTWLSKEQKRMHMDPFGELHGLEVALYYAGEKKPKVCHFCWDMGTDLSLLPEPLLSLINGMYLPLSAIRSEGVAPTPQDTSLTRTALRV